MKTCKQCKNILPEDSFYKDDKLTSGLTNECKDCIRERTRQWRLDNPQRRAEQRVRNYYRRQTYEQDRIRVWRANTGAVERGLEATLTVEQWTAKRDALNGECFYCAKPATTLDHYMPLTKGGASVIDNIVPACLSCNSSKKDKMPDEWTRDDQQGSAPCVLA